MKMNYEGVYFHVSPSTSIELHLIKQRIKKSIGRYKKDPYLSFGELYLQKRAAPTVIDVGANIGTTVLPLAKRFPNGRFIAIEAHPIPAARFIQNCQSNKLPNVSLVNAAIAPQSELLNIYSCSCNSGGHRITANFEQRTDVPPLPSLKHVSVISLPLTSIFAHFHVPYCDLLKIDVEGFECQVLESMQDLLSPSKVGLIVAEYGPGGLREAGKTGWDMVQMMKEKGFRCTEIQTGKKIESPSDIPDLADNTVTDFLFYSGESAFNNSKF